MMNPMCSSVTLLFCVAFGMLDHCIVRAMQSGRNINAKPFVPQQEQEQQQQQQQQQRQWQQEQEYAYLHGSPPYQHNQPMPREHSNYGSPPYQYQQHQPMQQIPPQYLEESPFYGMPSSPPQHHLPMPNQQLLPQLLGHQFPSQHLGRHQQMVSSSPPQTFSSPMHLTPMAEFSSSRQLMSPLLPAHYDLNMREKPAAGGGHVGEPYELDELMNNFVDFAVKSGERGAKDKPTGHEQSKPFNPFFASSSSSNDPLRHLTSLLQTIPQGTSLFSETPALIAGTSKHATKPLNPVQTISPSAAGSSRIADPNAGAKKDNTEKFTLGTIQDNLLTSMADKEPEKPKSRGIPPGFTAKNPIGIPSHIQETADVSPVKVVSKYLEAVNKPPAPPSPSKSPANEAQIKPKNPNTVESNKLAIPEGNVGDKTAGAQKSKTSDSNDRMSSRKSENSSSPADASSTKIEGGSKDKYSNFKQKEQKKNRGKQKGNNQGQSTKITNVAPKEAHKTIPAEFLPTSKGKQGKSEVEKSSDSVTNKFTELPTDDEKKLESDSETEKSRSSSDNYSDPDDMGLEEETFVDALPFFETKDGKKKKSTKQLKREKELADAKAIEEFKKKREQELEDAKGKGKAEETTEETNKEIDERSAKNKEKLKAAKGRLELHKNTDRVDEAMMEDWFRQWHRNEKNRAIKSTPTDSTCVTSEMLQERKTPVDHHNEIKTLLNILKYDRIMGISIANTDEEQTKKDIRYLLYTIQLFYETLYKYWHKNNEFHDLNEYAYIGEVLTKIGQFYTDKGANEENLEQFERAEESLEKIMHILSKFWMILEYREFMESQVFSKDEGKYKFVKWMDAFEQLLNALKLFNIKIKRFNRSYAKKTGSNDRLKVHFKKSTIQPYYETVLNLKFRTIFGIVFIGMDKQALDARVAKKALLTGLKYLQNWLPDRKAELAHTRKVIWNYFKILDYVSEKDVRQNFKTYFKDVMGYPMPEGNYIEIKHGNHASLAVYSAEIMLAGIFKMLRDENGDNISSEVENALNAVKEHLHCANFLFTMYEKIYWKFDDKTNKHNVHMGVEARNFWKVVDKEKCMPAEENYRKIENSAEYQKFLQDNPRFKNKIENAIKSLDELFVEYNIEERRKEARGECDCCKPEEGYEKDSEEEKEELGKEKELEEAGKEVTEKQEITQVQEEPIEAAALSEI